MEALVVQWSFVKVDLGEKCPNAKLLRKSPNSVRIQENMDQK